MATATTSTKSGGQVISIWFLLVFAILAVACQAKVKQQQGDEKNVLVPSWKNGGGSGSSLETKKVVPVEEIVTEEPLPELDITGKLDHLTMLVGKLLLKMDTFERRMTKAENTFDIIKSTLHTNQIELREKRHSLPSRGVNASASTLAVIEVLEEKFRIMFERLSRLELTMDNVESQIHLFKTDSPPASPNCIDKKYLNQLITETKKYIKTMAHLKEEAAATSATPSSKVSLEQSTSFTPETSQFAAISFHLRTLVDKMLNVSDGIAQLHYELTEGKIDEIEQAVQKVRTLYSDLVEELEMKNGRKSAGKESDSQTEASRDVYTIENQFIEAPIGLFPPYNLKGSEENRKEDGGFGSVEAKEEKKVKLNNEDSQYYYPSS